MRNIPQELFLALIFGAVLLVQFVYQLLRRKAQAMQTEADFATQPRLPPGAVPLPIQAEKPIVYTPVEAPQDTPTRPPARVSPPARLLHPHRFSRQGLMPDRRAVQEAIVIAAIIQPCHAHRPYEVE